MSNESNQVFIQKFRKADSLPKTFNTLTCSQGN
uniref:Uncharacterized protein n=1 Tax=Anguilla anguilla TaxID=7936 RepID=A0A0E9TSA1_ANGAN